MIIFTLSLLLTIALSYVIERYIKPKAAVFNKQTYLLQALNVSVLFLAVTLIVQRPIFAALAVLVFLIILVAVSNAKFQALKEPMVFSDIAMFSQAFKHPRLYFPFLGMRVVVIAPLVIAWLIFTVLWLEPAMPFTFDRIIKTLIMTLVCLYFMRMLALKLDLQLEPERDNAKHGLLNSLVAYSFQANTQTHKQQIKETLQSSPFFTLSKNKITNKHPSERPNITVIQSESFFDARRLHPSIKTSVLKNFDVINTESIAYGKLKVPAWGANTMRSEFSFLTGLSFKDLGFYRFYPYQYLSKTSVPSIASVLQAQGYYCVCIHPHPASFFGRDKIFPKMGFDEFIDIGSFEGAEKFGPYISDQAVTDKILEITKQITDKPLFIFAITMENHGPLHLEKISIKEDKSFYGDDNFAATNDLSVYLRHLKNADKMIAELTNNFKMSSQKSLLCFYGDHVPSMPTTYQATDYHDSHSDYFIWHSALTNQSSHQNTNKTTHIESLTLALLKAALQKTS